MLTSALSTSPSRDNGPSQSTWRTTRPCSSWFWLFCLGSYRGRDGCFFLVLKHAFHCQGAPAQGLSVRWVPGLTSFEECCLLITQLVLAALLSWLSWQAICHSVISPTLFDADGTFSKESTFFLFFKKKMRESPKQTLRCLFLRLLGSSRVWPLYIKKKKKPYTFH